MPSIKKKRRPTTLVMKYRIITFFLILALAAVAGVFWPAYVWSSQIDVESKKLISEKDRLLAQNEKLAEEVRKLSTMEYIEQLARKDLGLVKPGEIPISRTAPSKR